MAITNLSTTTANGANQYNTSAGSYPSLAQGVAGAAPTGAPGAQPPLFGGVLSMLLKRKTDAADYALRRQQELDAQANQDRARAQAPTLGSGTSAPQEKVPTRMVLDPYRNPYEKFISPGASPRMVKERFIGGAWEFDKVDPSRQGGGGAGSIDTKVSPSGGYSSAPGSGDSRMANLVSQQAAAGRNGPPQSSSEKSVDAEKTQAGTGPLTVDTGYSTDLQKQQTANKKK